MDIDVKPAQETNGEGNDQKSPFCRASIARCSISQGQAQLGGVLGGLAEFERELIRVRTGQGRRRAVDAGVKLGRRSSLTAYQQKEVLMRRADGETFKDLAKSYGVTHPTIIRALRKFEAPISVS
jgi:DNA invertase Pin-like site-specific DNA recombinase